MRNNLKRKTMFSVSHRFFSHNNLRRMVNVIPIISTIFLVLLRGDVVSSQHSFGKHGPNITDFKIKRAENPQKIIQSFGYPAETHHVTTNDGYILTLHRIPKGNKEGKEKRPPVLLMHGLTFSSADFVNLDPSRSLGYILADNGYDVWLGNARGNSYSNKHVVLNSHTHPKIFYDFSWHEIGTIDVPTKIDYILNVTKEESLYYIGHSQGCTAFYVMTSTRPEYNKKIRLASLMGPAGYVSGIPEPFGQFFSQFLNEIEAFTSFFQIYHIPRLDLIRSYLHYYCQNDIYYAFCKELYYTIGAGYGDDPQLNKSIFPLIFRTTPSDASTKQFFHYFQEIKSGKFRQFDYGPKRNFKVYGKKYPPDYNLTAISAPVAIYYGRNDRFVAVKDIQRIIRRLKNVANDYLIPYKKFNHGDFLFATDVNSLLYNEMLRVMNLY